MLFQLDNTKIDIDISKTGNDNIGCDCNIQVCLNNNFLIKNNQSVDRN